MISTINFCIIATIVVYLLAMLAIGFVFSKKNSNSEDFYLGGRKMGPLVTAMSAEASDMSSWLLMGMPGLAYLSGIADPGWTASRYMAQLVDCSKKASALFCKYQCHYGA